MHLAAALAVVTVSTVAFADTLAFGLGAGVRRQQLSRELKASPQADPIEDPSDTSASLTAMVGARVRPWLAIGGRISYGRLDAQKRWGRTSAGPAYDGYVRTPLDLAAVVQLEWKRLWLAPWAGLEAIHELDQNRTIPDAGDMEPTSYDLRSEWSAHLAGGLTFGVDVFAHGADRAALYVDLQHGTAGYSAVTLGAAYRR